MAILEVSDRQFGALLEQLSAPAPVPLNRAIWSARDVAAYLRVTPRYVSERLANRPDFPEPKRIPTSGGRGSLRWRALDVVEWWEKK